MIDRKDATAVTMEANNPVDQATKMLDRATGILDLLFTLNATGDLDSLFDGTLDTSLDHLIDLVDGANKVLGQIGKAPEATTA